MQCAPGTYETCQIAADQANLGYFLLGLFAFLAVCAIWGQAGGQRPRDDEGRGE